jgi:hypothetical protein
MGVLDVTVRGQKSLDFSESSDRSLPSDILLREEPEDEEEEDFSA